MEYIPIDQWSDKDRLNHAWFKIKEAVDKRDVHMVRKMYHLIQWIEGGKKPYKKKQKHE